MIRTGVRIRARRTIVAVVGALLVTGAFVAGANIASGTGTTNGDPVTFGKVNCTAHLSGGGTLSQKQDVGGQAAVPNQVNQGDAYTITIPGGTATLPNTGQGIPILQFTNLDTTYEFDSSAGSVTITDATASGGATFNGAPVNFNVTHTGTTVTLDTPGPLVLNGAPGQITTPDVTISVTAPNADATVTSFVTEVDTTATLSGLGAVPVTCPVPHANPQTDGISATLVGAGGPTTSSEPSCRPVTGTCDTTSTTSTSTSSSSTTSTTSQGPKLSISDATITRPDRGTAKMTFTVMLAPSASKGVSVKYETVDGTAHTPIDYKHKKGTLSFKAGATTKTITILVTGGLIGQPDRSFTLHLSNPKNASIVDGDGTGTIVDKHLPGVSVGDATVKRPTRGSAKMIFTVTLTKPSTKALPVKVTFTTQDLTAHNKVDYKAKHGTVTFKNGATTATITVTVPKSSTAGTVVFVMDLTGAKNAIITDATGAGTITP